MIEKIELHVKDELDEFYEDLKISQINLKFFSRFKSDIKIITENEIITNQMIFDEPKQNFKTKSKVKEFKKINKSNKSKSIF